MMKIEDITRAVSALAPGDLARFRTWFEEFDAERFDRKIEKSVKAGKLDRRAAKALADHRAGRARQL